RSMRAIDYFDKGVKQFADRCAIVAGDRRYSYAELQEETKGIARGLWANGMHTEDRVAIYSPNDARVLACMLGLLRAGAVWVPINYRNAIDANVEYMKYVETAWMFYHSAFRESVGDIRKRVPTLKNFVCIDAECDGDLALVELATRGAHFGEMEWGDAQGNP